MGLKIIITGTTGMVGEGVMQRCLDNPNVEKVLAISRKPNGHHHPKLVELIHKDFADLTSVEEQCLFLLCWNFICGCQQRTIRKDHL
jgi:nucleoside-diphosphate-sugar epimerase